MVRNHHSWSDQRFQHEPHDSVDNYRTLSMLNFNKLPTFDMATKWAAKWASFRGSGAWPGRWLLKSQNWSERKRSRVGNCSCRANERQLAGLIQTPSSLNAESEHMCVSSRFYFIQSKINMFSLHLSTAQWFSIFSHRKHLGGWWDHIALVVLTSVVAMATTSFFALWSRCKNSKSKRTIQKKSWICLTKRPKQKIQRSFFQVPFFSVF